MPVDHSPKAKTSSTGSRASKNTPISNEVILAAIQKSDASINRKLDFVLDRLEKLEENHKNMEIRIQTLENANLDVLQDVEESKEKTNEIKDTVTQLKEIQDRSWRKNNEILFNVP